MQEEIVYSVDYGHRTERILDKTVLDQVVKYDAAPTKLPAPVTLRPTPSHSPYHEGAGNVCLSHEVGLGGVELGAMNNDRQFSEVLCGL